MAAKKKSRIRRVYQKAKRRVSRMKISLAVVGGFMPLAFNTIKGFQDGGIKNALNVMGRSVTGYDGETGRWDWTSMKVGTFPIVGGAIVHKVAGWLGVNRLMSRMKLPFNI